MNRLERIREQYLRSAYSDVPGEDVAWLMARVKALQLLCQEVYEDYGFTDETRLMRKLRAAFEGKEIRT